MNKNLEKVLGKSAIGQLDEINLIFGDLEKIKQCAKENNIPQNIQERINQGKLSQKKAKSLIKKAFEKKIFAIAQETYNKWLSTEDDRENLYYYLDHCPNAEFVSYAFNHQYFWFFEKVIFYLREKETIKNYTNRHPYTRFWKE
jgi:hypothetical protein